MISSFSRLYFIFVVSQVEILKTILSYFLERHTVYQELDWSKFVAIIINYFQQIMFFTFHIFFGWFPES